MSDINIGAITEALNDKTDRDMQNVDITTGADAVIEYQEPTSENNYTWYRKYKSGWVEQGGKINTSTTSISLPIEMLDDNYSCFITYTKTISSDAAGLNKFTTATQSTTGFTVTSSTLNRIWQVCGKAA